MGKSQKGDQSQGINRQHGEAKPRTLHYHTVPMIPTHPATSNYIPEQFQTNEAKANELRKILKIV